MAQAGRRAVFLDRDGTLIHDVGYIKDPDKVQLFPGLTDHLTRLKQRGFALVVVSNQSGIGRKLLTPQEAKQVHVRFVDRLAECRLQLDGAYYCPHAPDEGCLCRKPSPGMLLQAAAELGLNLAGSFMVGDKPSDVEAGSRAQCRTILLTSTPSTSVVTPRPHKVAADWAEIVSYILD